MRWPSKGVSCYLILHFRGLRQVSLGQVPPPRIRSRSARGPEPLKMLDGGLRTADICLRGDASRFRPRVRESVPTLPLL